MTVAIPAIQPFRGGRGEGGSGEEGPARARAGRVRSGRKAIVILSSRRVRDGGEKKDEESTQSCHRKGPMQTHCERRCGVAAARDWSYLAQCRNQPGEG